MTIVQDELTEPVNAQDMARNYKQAYEKNDVQKMAKRDVANAVVAEASPAFFFYLVASSCSLRIFTDDKAVGF